MNYTYAVMLLAENDTELNETNITAVLEAADAHVERSRVKALVAALEDVDAAAIAAGDGPDDPQIPAGAPASASNGAGATTSDGDSGDDGDTADADEAAGDVDDDTDADVADADGAASAVAEGAPDDEDDEAGDGHDSTQDDGSIFIPGGTGEESA